LTGVVVATRAVCWPRGLEVDLVTRDVSFDISSSLLRRAGRDQVERRGSQGSEVDEAT
jgi:hypothetical protein